MSASVVPIVAASSAAFFASYAIPFVIAIGHGEHRVASGLFLIGAVGGFFAMTVRAAVAGRRFGARRNDRFLALVLVWLSGVTACALPFLIIAEMSWSHALFEAASGLTTTGASTIPAGAQMPVSLIIWRSQLEWMGGYLTLAGIAFVMSRRAGDSHDGSVALATSELGQRHSTPARWSHRELLVRYVSVSLVVYILLLASGASALDSLILTSTGIGTGGYIPWAEPLGERFDVATLAVLAITLAIGATSLFWTYMSVSTFWQRLGGNIEARWVLATMVVLGLAYGWLLADAGGRTDVASLLAALGEGLFAAVSLVSTTAIETRPGVIGLLPEIFVLTVVLFGASAFATSGGLKLVRLGALVVHVRRELRLLIYPSSISGSGIAGIRYTPEDIRIIWVPFLLFLAAGSATIFTMTVATGHFESNVVAAFALLANTGGLLPALAPAGVTQAWPLWQDLNAFEHVLCAFVMLLGRLEFLAIFAALNLRYWLGR